MKAVPALTAEAPQPPAGASPIPSRDQDFPHESSTRHATGSGGPIPSHLRNITHSSSPSPLLTPTPPRATTSCAQLHRREEEPSLGPLEPSLDASCKSSIHQNNDYAEFSSSCGHHNNTPQNCHDGSNLQDISNCNRSSTMAIEDDNSARWKKRHSLLATSATTATTSFASAAATNTIAPTTPPPPIHTTLSTTPIPPPSSPPPRTTTTTIPITFTYKDRSSTTPPRNLSETITRTTSAMPSSSNNNNNNNQAHRSTNLTGVDGSGKGEGGAGAGATGGGNSKRLSISTQLQRSSTSRDAKSPTALARLDGSSNSGSSVVRMNEHAAWPGHARLTLLAGGSGVGGQWKSNTVLLSSSSSSMSASSLTRKYETASKGIDHSANTPAQQQQPHLGTINGSGLQQQSGRQSQPSSETATASATAIGSTFLQQDSNTTEMDTFSETHSGVIMAYPNTSSSHQTNITVNGPGSTGLSDFVRSLFSQSLVSRLHSHRSRFSSVSVGTSSWSVMRVFNACYLLYLIPLTSITIAQLITVDMICNEQLYSWLTVQAFMFLSQIVSTCNILQRQAMMISSSRANAIDQRTRIMLFIFMIWTVVGVGFLGSENGNSQDPCSTTNDPIYILSFKIIIFHVAMIGIYFLPCSSLLLTRVFPNSISSGLTRTATKPMIDKLGSTPMVEGMFGGDVEEATCAICLGDYKPGETIRFLPCHHHFHLECVDQWLATDKSCPLCKHDIDKPLDIHNSRRTAITHANNNTHTNSNASEDDTHHNHNSVRPSHNTSGNNAIGMDGFQVIIV